eukprot:4201185-Karenia_brevis.AAC.1
MRTRARSGQGQLGGVQQKSPSADAAAATKRSRVPEPEGSQPAASAAAGGVELPARQAHFIHICIYI